jgi:hypothetical protein
MRRSMSKSLITILSSSHIAGKPTLPLSSYHHLPHIVQYAYLSPQNLSNAFPFFSGVSSVSTFDVAALNYFTNPEQFETTKFTNQLGCSNASNAVIRYERTVLCSMWVNEMWSAQCLANYSGFFLSRVPITDYIRTVRSHTL